MAEFTANAIQLVAVNQNILFTDTPVKGGRYISHRDGSGLITLKGNKGCNCQANARYLVTFSGNIAVPTGQTPGAISLGISYDGEPVGSTNMIVTPAAVDEYFNFMVFYTNEPEPNTRPQRRISLKSFMDVGL